MSGWNWAMPCTYKCGHKGIIERPTCQALNYVTHYAETVRCWPCWLKEKAR